MVYDITIWFKLLKLRHQDVHIKTVYPSRPLPILEHLREPVEEYEVL